MSKKAVFCLATSRRQADRIVDHLKTESFSNQAVSLLLSDVARDFAQDGNAVGSPISFDMGGGAFSWIAGIGALAIPGVGPFIAAGPVRAALRGASSGDIADGLISLGVGDSDAQGYQGRIKEGNILIAVHTDDAGDIARFRDIFRRAGAQAICTTPVLFPDRESAISQASPAAEPAPAQCSKYSPRN
jgi:hypothetical protein